jgi:hypothetical protein
MPSPAIIGDNLVFADVMIDGKEGAMVVDTGAPIVLVDPRQFPGANLPSMGAASVNVSFGALTVDAVPAYSDSTDPLPFGGLVGGNLLRQFSAQFDYRDQTLRLGDGLAPTGVEQPGVSVSFTLGGGGLARISPSDTHTILVIPPTRIPVTVDIEGVSHPFILDTGASAVVLRSTIYNQLVSDQRPQLATSTISTVYGMMAGHFSRARTITVGGQQVVNAPLLNVGDDLLDSLAAETGQPVDGLLGGTFLREFLVTIDYPHGALLLQRYSPPATIADEFRRVGIDLGPDNVGTHAYGVASVYAGSDAAQKGVAADDQLVAIDGLPLDALDPFTVERMLLGTVGTTHAIQFGITAISANQGMTLVIRVDDLLPNP